MPKSEASGNNGKVRVQPERKRWGKPGQTVESDLADGKEGLSHLPEALLRSDFSQRSFEHHAALLADPRMSRRMYTSQRAAIVMQLQRDYGNRYVQRLVKRISQMRAEAVQAKLTVGPAGDKYEQEADKVAKQVMETVSSPGQGAAQRQAPEEDGLQMKPVAQRQALEQEELQMKPLVQRRQDLEEGEALQMKPLAQRQPMDEEEEAPQAKPLAQRQVPLEGGDVDRDAENTIQQAKGGGQALPENVRCSMEGAFGANFSGVRVHTGPEADALNDSMSARAFTTGQDIFLKRGEYDPGSSSGQELLAHELTHVVQQGEAAPSESHQSGQMVQRMPEKELHNKYIFWGCERLTEDHPEITTQEEAYDRVVKLWITSSTPVHFMARIKGEADEPANVGAAFATLEKQSEAVISEGALPSESQMPPGMPLKDMDPESFKRGVAALKPFYPSIEDAIARAMELWEHSSNKEDFEARITFEPDAGQQGGGGGRAVIPPIVAEQEGEAPVGAQQTGAVSMLRQNQARLKKNYSRFDDWLSHYANSPDANTAGAMSVLHDTGKAVVEIGKAGLQIDAGLRGLKITDDVASEIVAPYVPQVPGLEMTAEGAGYLNVAGSGWQLLKGLKDTLWGGAQSIHYRLKQFRHWVQGQDVKKKKAMENAYYPGRKAKHGLTGMLKGGAEVVGAGLGVEGLAVPAAAVALPLKIWSGVRHYRKGLKAWGRVKALKKFRKIIEERDRAYDSDTNQAIAEYAEKKPSVCASSCCFSAPLPCWAYQPRR